MLGERAGSRRTALLALGVLTSIEFVVTAVRIFSARPADLLGRFMADDAFYYFDIARRFPHVGTTSGITTTGFHPLYWLALVPVFALAHGIAAVRASLLMLLVVHLAAGWLLYAILSRRWPLWTALTVAGIWICSAELRTIVLLGVEAAFVEVTVLALVYVCGREAPPTMKRCAAVGGLFGLSYLARNDSLFVCAPIVLVWLWSRRTSLDWGRVATVAASAAVVAAPWVGFLIVDGSFPSTDSSRALPYNPNEQGSFATVVKRAVGEIGSHLASFVRDQYRPENFTRSGAVLGVVVVGAIVAGLLRRREWEPFDIGLAIGVPLVYGLYLVTVRDVRDWYLVYLFLGLFVVVAPPLVDVGRRWLTRVVPLRLPASAVWPALVAIAVAAAEVGPFAMNPQEGLKYRAAQAADHDLPSGAAVGSLNSGIYQFVLADHRVVNLDGVVNPAVLPDLRAHDLCPYVDAHHLGWYIDDVLTMKRFDGEERGPTGAVTVLVRSPAKDGNQVLVHLDPTTCR